MVRATKRRPSIFTREEQRRLPAISPQPQPLGGAGEGLSLQELQQDFVWGYLFRAYVLGPFIGREMIHFEGHVGSNERLPKAPPLPPTWKPEEAPADPPEIYARRAA